MNLDYLNNISKKVIALILIVGVIFNFLSSNKSILQAFPIYAQQGYEDPREATGRIVCANCHLAQKPIIVETPQSTLPNTVFEAIIKIPYDIKDQQILSNGTKGPLNIGAIVILPEGFKLAPPNLISNKIKEKNKRIYIQPYSTAKDNILIVGPVPGNQNQEISFPILSPDPSKNKNVHFLKYPIYAGANRGRGQVYPSGDKSNNNIIAASASGKVVDINEIEQGGYNIQIEKTSGEIVVESIPKGLKLETYKGENISINQALTQDPNVGGFGQNETEIVLQNPDRIKGMIVFFFIITIAQIFFVLKKKQWEKVQAADMNF